MKKLIAIPILSLTLAGCNGLEGILSIQGPLSIVVKKGQAVPLNPGSSVRATIEVEKDGREIDIKFKDSMGKDRKAELKLPPGVQVPQYSGTFSVLGSQVGQPFNLSGSIDTQVDESPRYRTRESCTETDRELVCYWVERPVPGPGPGPGPHPGHGHPGHGGGGIHREQVCEWRLVTLYGDREVEYHNRITTVRGLADFTDPSSNMLLATFSGSNSRSEKIYDYVGPCFVHRRPGHGGGWNNHF